MAKRAASHKKKDVADTRDTAKTKVGRTGSEDSKGSAKTKDDKGKTKDTSKGKPAAKASRRRRPGELTRFQKMVIVLFVAVFALSTLASALASVFGTTTSTDDSTTEDTSSEYTVEAMDERYSDLVADLEAQLEEDPDDAATLLALGRYYASWGMYVSALASTDDETTHASELFDQAIAYYDAYIELEDSNAARVDRAMCLYYQGDTSAAISALEEITEASPDYALAWANLGMLYEEEGSTDAAIAAYELAVENDPDDEYGAKSYAEERLAELEEEAEEEEESDDEDSDTSTDDMTDTTTEDTTDDTSSSDLSSDLSELSGTDL